LAQDWPNFEMVIIDDFSADNSVDMVMRAIAKTARARLIRHSRNVGTAAARNTILSEAKGEFIAFFDDDDESLSTRVSRQIKTLLEYEDRTGVELVACYASGIRRYPNGYTLGLPAIGSRGGETPRGAAIADYLLINRRRPAWFYGSGTPACALMARRSTFASVGDFDPELRRVEDADFAIRLALMGGHFIGTDQIQFVQHATSSPDKSPAQNLEAEQRLVLKHRSYLESIDRFEYAKRWPMLRHYHFSRRYDLFLLTFLSLLARHPLAASHHLLSTGPRRLCHERRMRQSNVCG
jgi:glycosyltransferase involved in cell wall biosynthesis